MGNAGLALYYAMPKVIELQERAQRMKQSEKISVLENKLTEKNIELADENIKGLKERAKELQKLNTPIEWDKIDKENPIIKTLMGGATEKGLAPQDLSLATVKDVQNVYADIDKYPDYWATKFNTANDELVQKITPIKAEIDRVNASIQQNQAILADPNAD